jgi:hypothetical protein
MARCHPRASKHVVSFGKVYEGWLRFRPGWFLEVCGESWVSLGLVFSESVWCVLGEDAGLEALQYQTIRAFNLPICMRVGYHWPVHLDVVIIT